MRRKVQPMVAAIGGVAILLVVVGALYVVFVRGEDERAVHGTFMITTDNLSDTCHGEGGYSDIHPGTEVRLIGDEGLLDVTRLGSALEPVRISTGCIFTFTLHVPRGHRFYTVEVGRRGSFNYTWDEITSERLSYSIGN